MNEYPIKVSLGDCHGDVLEVDLIAHYEMDEDQAVMHGFRAKNFLLVLDSLIADYYTHKLDTDQIARAIEQHEAEQHEQDKAEHQINSKLTQGNF